MLENIEKLGSEGEVEQAQSMMKLCDQLKEEREQLQTQKGGVGYQQNRSFRIASVLYQLSCALVHNYLGFCYYHR